MKKLYIIISLISLSLMGSHLSAQTDSVATDTTFSGHAVSSDWIDHGISMGIDFSKYFYGEIGYYRSFIYEAGGFPTFSSILNFGSEFSYLDNLVIAPKVQGRIHAYFLNASLTALCYTDLKDDIAIKLRPELGIGLWNLDLNYGYNIGIYKTGFMRTNRHVFTIRYYLRLYRKHLNEYDPNGNKRPED